MSLPIRTALQKRGFDPAEKRDDHGRWTKTGAFAEALAALAPEEKNLRRRARTVAKREREVETATDDYEAMKGGRPTAEQVRSKYERIKAGGGEPSAHLENLYKAHKNLSAAMSRWAKAQVEKDKVKDAPPPEPTAPDEEKPGAAWEEKVGKFDVVVQRPTPGGGMTVAARSGSGSDFHLMITNPTNGKVTVTQFAGPRGPETRNSIDDFIGDARSEVDALAVAARRHMTDEEAASLWDKREKPPVMHAQGATSEDMTRRVGEEFAKFGFTPNPTSIPAVAKSPKRLDRLTLGQYHSMGLPEKPGKPMILYRKPDQVGATRNAQELATVIHEYGHHLDSDGASEMGRYQSTEHSGALRSIVQALLQTPSMRRLAGLPPEVTSDKRKRYLLKPEELWARAFAQYVATKSRNIGMLAGARGTFSDGGHWPDDEFAPILAMIDNLFKERGWLT